MNDIRLLEDGQIIRDKYEVDRFLGSGAFGEVYRVKHRFLGRQAMKVFKNAGMTAEETERMLDEALLLSRLNHPNIVRVYDADTTQTLIGECGFFTMEWIAGGSLEQFWSAHGQRFVPVKQAVEIILQVARGLAVAHSAQPPIIHRDIKPQNVLVSIEADGLRARVSDFGLAKRVNPLTLLASSRGTRQFKAPEALQDLGSDSCAGDIWAIGVTLYLLLTDRLPYPDIENLRYGIPAGRSSDFTEASEINLEVNPQLDRILARCLALRKNDRYANANELARELETWRPGGAPAVSGRSDLSSGGSSFGKVALGTPAAASRTKGEEMAARALQLARDIRHLDEAADLMEQACNQWPQLREKYGYKMQLWRKGIVQ